MLKSQQLGESWWQHRQSSIGSNSSDTDSDTKNKYGEEEEDEGDQGLRTAKIIKQLLEIPSPHCCGTNYVAVGMWLNFSPLRF